MVGLQTDVLRPQIALRLLAVSEFPAGGVFHQPPGPGIIGVHNAGVTVSEQDGLGIAVGLHGLVEIQVVLGQIRKDAHGVMDAVHPVQIQGMGGRLHHHMGAASRAHLSQKSLQLKGFRGGALRGEDLLADHVLVRADKAHLGPQGLFQNGLEQIGRGGLAVRSGDGHHGHAVGGVAVEIGADCRESTAGVRHPDIGNTPPGYMGPPFRNTPPGYFFAQHRRRAGLHGLTDIVVAVHRKAGHRHKQVAGPGLAGVIAHMGNLHLHIRCGFQNGRSL